MKANTAYKRLIVLFWERIRTKQLVRKFRLYGDYNTLYSWEKYKMLDEHIKLFKNLHKKVNPEWYKYFTLVRQQEDINHIPEDIWHNKMEPALNHRAYEKAFNDKNLYDNTAYKELFPTTLVHIIEGIAYDKDYIGIDFQKAIEIINNTEYVVCKKSVDSGGGKGVSFYNTTTENLELSKLIGIHGNNIVIQEAVKQHKWFSSLNYESVNTIRVITYRSVTDESVHVLQAILRMGKPGNKVDNQSSGGIACGIDLKGNLNEWGCDKLSRKFTEINGIVFALLGKVPNFENLKSTCIEIATKRFFERVLVFDTWQDEQGNIRLLEINNVNIGIEDIQKNNGPMFREFTEEVIEYCSSAPLTYCFDFNIEKS